MLQTTETLEILRRSTVMAAPGTNVPVNRELLLALIAQAAETDAAETLAPPPDSDHAGDH